MAIYELSTNELQQVGGGIAGLTVIFIHKDQVSIGGYPEGVNMFVKSDFAAFKGLMNAKSHSDALAVWQDYPPIYL